jgi:hypothetical protein
MTVNSTIFDLGLNVVGGIIGALIGFTWARLVTFISNRRQFRKYRGSYLLHNKYAKANQPAIFKINLSVSGNKFSIRGSDILTNSELRGTVIMDRDLSDYGTGHYLHGDDGWGFIQIQITPRGEIHSHHQYASGGTLYSFPYVWTKTRQAGLEKWEGMVMLLGIGVLFFLLWNWIKNVTDR